MLRTNVLRETGTLFEVNLQYFTKAGCSINEKEDTVLTISCKLALLNSASPNFLTGILPTSLSFNCLHSFELDELFDLFFAHSLYLVNSFGCTI